METQPKRLNRWDDEPIYSIGGKPLVARIEESDYRIFGRFSRYRHISTSFMVAFEKRNACRLQARMNLLSRKPNKYLHRPKEQQKVPNANYKDQTYELAEKGETLYLKRAARATDLFGDAKLFAHSMMVNHTLQSLELFAPRMIWRDEIPGAGSRIPVKVSCMLLNGELAEESFDYQNDSHGPFGIHYGTTARFFQLEAEHHGEVERNNLKQTSFLKKFLAMRHIAQNDLYRKEWGLPHLLTLVVCKDQHDIERRKELIMRVTDSKGASYVLFQVVPAVDECLTSIKPMPQLYTGPWQRAGHPDFFINQP